jgi:hypothetical protein
MDNGIVHDGYGCYPAKFFSSPELTLFFVSHHRLGAAFFQQASLEGVAGKKITFPIYYRYV